MMTARAESRFRNLSVLSLAILLAAAFISAPMFAQINEDDYDVHHASKVDIYGGFSYFTRETDTVQKYQFPTMPYGVIGQGAYFLKPWLGLEAGGSYQMTYKYDNLYFVQGGPTLRYKAPNNGLSVFFHGLAGGVNISGPNTVATTSPLVYSYYNPATWGQAYGAGLGIDYDTPFFNHRVAIRLAQVDYEVIRVNYGTITPTGGGQVNFDALRMSAGLVWHFGGGPKRAKKQALPEMPEGGPSLSCSASPTTISAGDPVNITAVASGFDPRYSIAYAWSSTGGRISGSDATISLDTHGLTAGTYTTSVHATSGKQTADCTANFTLAAPQPPTLSCAANPSIVTPGQTVTITSQGYSPANRPLTYSFKTSGGTASGAGNAATLSTTGLATGPVTVICDTVDDMGRTAEATATFMVNAPVAPAAQVEAIHTEPLCDISFSRDRARPTRVDNEAKACLDSIALSAQRSTDAQIVIVGDAAPSELGGNLVAAQRAVNTKDYLVTEKGIDASRIEVRTGGSGGKVVQSFLVPPGADFESDYSGSIPVSAAIQPQARIPLTTRRRSTVRRKRRPVHRTTAPVTSTNIPPATQSAPPQ